MGFNEQKDYTMKENLKRYIASLLVVVIVAGIVPVATLADTFTSNVIGPLTLEEEEVDFGEPDPSADLESEEDFVATEAGTFGPVVSFAASGFSVYAITTDFTTPTYETPVTSIQENAGYFLSNQSRYITNNLYIADAPHGLGKTQNRPQASLFYFEKAEGENAYYIYTYPDPDSTAKQYVYFAYYSNDVSHIRLTDNKSAAALLTVTAYNSSGTYVIGATVRDDAGNPVTMYMNQNAGTGGKRFSGYKNGSNDAGSRITISQPKELPRDALELDGKSFALINFKSDISGYMMMADALNNNSRLERKWTLIREDSVIGLCAVIVDHLHGDAEGAVIHGVDRGQLHFFPGWLHDGEIEVLRLRHGAGNKPAVIHLKAGILIRRIIPGKYGGRILLISSAVQVETDGVA